MEPLYTAKIITQYGQKEISAYACDIMEIGQKIDILTTSAYYRSYVPTKATLFAALDSQGISVWSLSQKPAIDLRDMCNVWLSQDISGSGMHIRRIGCVEMIHNFDGVSRANVCEKELLNSIKAYFQMLDIASTYGVEMDTIALPLLGSGRQHISEDLLVIPIIRESMDFLQRNSAVKRIIFVERNPQKAFRIAKALQDSYVVNVAKKEKQESVAVPDVSNHLVFISYNSSDRNVADNLCAKLESKGIRVWYAPRNARNDYATSIAEALSKATHFVVILSKNSMCSEHVLNEIDLAFKKLPNHIKFKPLRIDQCELAPAFDYYLSRQHWMDAIIPPLEKRLDEFSEDILEDIK